MDWETLSKMDYFGNTVGEYSYALGVFIFAVVVLKIFKFVHSGRKTERADFEEVVEYIKKKKKEGIQIHYFIFRTVDRFSRAGVIQYLLMKARLSDLGVKS